MAGVSHGRQEGGPDQAKRLNGRGDSQSRWMKHYGAENIPRLRKFRSAVTMTLVTQGIAGSPTLMKGASFGKSRGSLDADDGSFVELFDGAGSGVGE